VGSTEKAATWRPFKFEDPAEQVPNSALFLAMLLRMGLAGFLGVVSRVKRVASSRVGMMCGFLVVSAIMMLGRFAVMVGSVCMMFGGLPMVLGCFFRHEYDPCYG
jgi:hypothetical protein